MGGSALAPNDVLIMDGARNEPSDLAPMLSVLLGYWPSVDSGLLICAEMARYDWNGGASGTIGEVYPGE